MFTLESRVFVGMAALAAAVAVLYGYASGDEVGITLLLAAAGASLAAGSLYLDVGGAAVAEAGEAAADTAGARAGGVPPEGPAPSGWPLVAAVSAAVALVGLANDVPLAVLGTGALVLAGAGWFLQVWQEHLALSRPANLAVQDRIIWPAGLPLLTLLGIAVGVVAFSRVLLALPKEAATAVALVVAAGILAGCTLIAFKPRLGSGVLVGLGGFTALALAVAGVVAASAGEREFHYKGPPRAAVVAEAVAFDTDHLEAPAHSVLFLDFENRDDGIPHNVAVYRDEGFTDLVFQGLVFNGVGSEEYRIRTGDPGTYYYRCDVHPTTMVGELEVTEEAAEGGGEHE